MNPLADALRQRQEAERLRGRGLQFQNVANAAGPTTVGGGMTGGMRGGQETPNAINWGSIIQQGVGNYQAAKDNKKADDMEARYQELSQQFLQDSFKDDPESAKLAQMAQMGVPGADKALEARLNPKKEALGAFLQHIQSGVADPAMVSEIAPRYGLSPEMASKAAETAILRQQQKQQERMDSEKEMIDYRAKSQAQYRAPSASSQRGDLSFQEYMSMSPEQQEAYNKFKGRKGASTEAGMTPGERNERAKAMRKLDEDILKGEQQIAKFENLRESLNNPDVFGAKQKIAQTLTEFENPILGGIGTSMRSKETMLLEDYLNSETLSRMAQLGGNDSNEELRRMRASLPTVMNNQEAALALMDQLDEWQRRTMDAIKNKRRSYQTGEYFSTEGEAPDFMGQTPVQPTAAPQHGSNAEQPARPRIKILSIE